MTGIRPWLACTVALSFVAGCGDSKSAARESACDEECLDTTALLGLRETVKLAFNLTLQGNAAGAQDESTLCPQGGQARVFGTATSNAEQGTMDVDLTYELGDCAYLRRDEEAEESYHLTLSGTLHQQGVLAVQPHETTALIMRSDSMTLEGTVYDPPIDYGRTGCAVELGQDGDRLSGTLCGRAVGVEL